MCVCSVMSLNEMQDLRVFKSCVYSAYCSTSYAYERGGCRVRGSRANLRPAMGSHVLLNWLLSVLLLLNEGLLHIGRCHHECCCLSAVLAVTVVVTCARRT